MYRMWLTIQLNNYIFCTNWRMVLKAFGFMHTEMLITIMCSNLCLRQTAFAEDFTADFVFFPPKCLNSSTSLQGYLFQTQYFTLCAKYDLWKLCRKTWSKQDRGQQEQIKVHCVLVWCIWSCLPPKKGEMQCMIMLNNN